MNRFHADFKPLGKHRCQLFLSGVLDAEAFTDVDLMLHQAIEEGMVEIDVDMTRVSDISSAGITALVISSIQARENDGFLHLLHPCERVSEKLEMLNLTDLLYPVPADSL